MGNNYLLVYRRLDARVEEGQEGPPGLERLVRTLGDALVDGGNCRT
jgi:hypothetical protein